jgi:hypothetical protein
VKEFSITFAPEKKISGRKLKQAMDSYHHFSTGNTKKIKSNYIGESPDNLDTVDDGSTRYRRVPARTDIFITCRGGARWPKFLRIEMKKYSHHDDNGNVLNQTSMDISPFITNLLDEI